MYSGSMVRVCSRRYPEHISISSGRGLRFPGGRHFKTLAMKTSSRFKPAMDKSSSKYCRRTDERLALQILVFTRGLPDDEHARRGVPDAENGLRAPFGKRALAARLDRRTDLVEGDIGVSSCFLPS